MDIQAIISQYGTFAALALVALYVLYGDKLAAIRKQAGDVLPDTDVATPEENAMHFRKLRQHYARTEQEECVELMDENLAKGLFVEVPSV